MDQVLASTEAREQLPKLIRRLISHPEKRIELGRQRRREVVLIAATRYDEMVQRENAVRDIAWALFAEERIKNPTSAPIPWEDAQRKRRRSA
jgi:PHD/YefM family antitoxin component YafN of YafNO toxin-antitoxin module